MVVAAEVHAGEEYGVLAAGIGKPAAVEPQPRAREDASDAADQRAVVGDALAQRVGNGEDPLAQWHSVAEADATPLPAAPAGGVEDEETAELDDAGPTCALPRSGARAD
jgi:hypothetical protein